MARLEVSKRNYSDAQEIRGAVLRFIGGTVLSKQTITHPRRKKELTEKSERVPSIAAPNL